MPGYITITRQYIKMFLLNIIHAINQELNLVLFLRPLHSLVISDLPIQSVYNTPRNPDNTNSLTNCLLLQCTVQRKETLYKFDTLYKCHIA